jgi:hypothetical protein
MQFNMYLLYKIVLINFVFWITVHHKEVLQCQPITILMRLLSELQNYN